MTEKLTDKLFKNRYVEDSGHPHIEIANQDVCRDRCSGKYCNYFCPAGVYEWDAEKQQTIVSFGNCIECGACAIGCPYDNILCQTPRGGYGVQFQLG
ncbi:4Fe-4S dicluster domain-containing protein [Candidatus Dormiibacter inghamiae]|uniref:ferredoxin family protein n=1 Tax=Candidatus Dormiibacter inghamiae TaxID=3127013 RepID=UPI0030C7230F